jgi:hypothetical protein
MSPVPFLIVADFEATIVADTALLHDFFRKE